MRFATVADKEAVEAICNHPEIRVWTAFDGAPMFDATECVRGPSFAVIGDEGCYLAMAQGEGRYVVHTNLLPSCRGSQAIRAAREAIKMAFVRTDTLELLSMVPQTNPQAWVFARSMGMRYLFTRKACWPVDGHLYDMRFFSITIDDWIASGACAASGDRFHQRLHGELGLPAHDDDPVHNAYVGAAVEMVAAGKPRKAVTIYNRWARLAMYEQADILSEDPLRIDIKQAVLRVEGEQFSVE